MPPSFSSTITVAEVAISTLAYPPKASTIYEYFTCSTFKEDKAEVWIQEHPDPSKKNQIYMTYKEPVIHDFYVFVPNNQSWLIGNPIIEENGKPHEMYPDPSYLGWYIRRYIDEEIPSSVLIYHEGDEDKKEAIGVNGEWETNATASPIPLAVFFEAFSSSYRHEGRWGNKSNSDSFS